jgi:hypothetical protein
MKTSSERAYDLGLFEAKPSLVVRRVAQESSPIDAENLAPLEAVAQKPPQLEVGAIINRRQIEDIAKLLEFGLFRKSEREEKKNFVNYVLGTSVTSVTQLSGIQAKSFLDRFGSYTSEGYTPHPEGIFHAIGRWEKWKQS